MLGKGALRWRVTMKHIAFAVVLSFLAVAAKATDHTVRLQINCYGNEIGWHFSHYDGQDTWDAVIQGISSGHIGRSQFTRIKAMDATTKRMKRGDKYDETFTIQGPGIYVLDFPDWDRSAKVEVRITIDGEVRFSATGAGDSIQQWADVKWGRDAKQANPREIAIKVD